MWKSTQRSQHRRRNKHGHGGGGKIIEISGVDAQMHGAQYHPGPVDRRWLKIDTQGNTQIVKIDRHKLTQQLGVQLRDLRVLDAKFSTNYPSAILCRENAIVVNLLHIRAILTTEYVLVVNPPNQDGESEQFVKELEEKLRSRYLRESKSAPVLQSLKTHPKAKTGNGLQINRALNGCDAYKSHSDVEDEQDSHNDVTDVPLARNPDCLAFELKALEICLESICAVLDSSALQLEGTAYPAGNDLTRQVNSQNLQRVRTAKSKNAKLRTNVETVKEILEKLLDDDEDMKAMNLTAKQQTHKSVGSPLDLGASPDPFGSTKQNRQSHPITPRSLSSSSSSSVDEDVQEVEMLLEPYFLQLDNTFNRLQALNEYIDIAEDLIIIEQDKHRNQLLQLELIITAGALALNFVAAIAGLFGMNLENKLGKDSPTPFLAVTGLSIAFALLVFISIFMFCRVKEGVETVNSSSTTEGNEFLVEKAKLQRLNMKLNWCWPKKAASTVPEHRQNERGNRSRPDFGFCDASSPDREAAYTGSSLNEEYFPSDDQRSETPVGRNTPESSDALLYRQLQQECDVLRKEKHQLTRALYDLESQSDALTMQCSHILQENNEQLKAALQSVAELNGIVKFLKNESQKQANVIADLKMEKTVLNNRLEAALGELYKKTGNTTFTMKERLLITPSRHPHGRITLNSHLHD